MESAGVSGADWVVPVLMGISLAACAGIRAWLPLLLVSVLAHFGYVQVNDSMAVIGDIHVLVALIIATVVEMIGDKIPAVDNFLDSVGTFIRPAAGTVVSSSLLTQVDGGVALLLGVLVGGGTAFSVHAGKTAMHAAATATAPVHLGLGNTVLSFIEDAVSIVTSILAVALPWVAAFCALTAVCLSIYMVVRFWRWRKNRRGEACTA